MKIDESHVVKLFKYVISHASISESGIQYSTDKVDYALDEISQIFTSYSFNSIKRCLYSLSNNKEEISYKRIERILKEPVEAIKGSESGRTRIFYIPIGITIEEKECISLFQKKLAFFTLQEAKEEIPDSVLNLQSVQECLLRTENVYIPETFIKVTIIAKTDDLAFNELWNYYQLIKALLEIQKSWGTQYIIHNTMDSRGKIDVPDWVVIKESRKYRIHHFKLSIHSSKQNLKFSHKEFIGISNLIKLIKNKSDESTLDFIIYRSFLLYNDALEQSDFNYCFLAFWQILETITLAERNNGDTKIIVDRMAPLTEIILGEKIPLKFTLDKFARQRCDLVHSGIGNIANDDINKIKYLCEVALSWIVTNKATYKTINNLHQFYLLRSCNKSTFDSIKAAIKILEKKT